ncbi:flippase [Ureibacillus aquaedulcis]|uniref:Flippase n=1 Tax=Ureibacillus aquaedulcis TaxID=3058421 RepID=A0ABT8GUL4_9BACL|nr:flippase [Ureibacillus sp. BA0131]MDN4495099.1 flippase [Ureibacillus sp. BA0131]
MQLTSIKKIITTKYMRNTGWLLFEQIFRMGLTLIVTTLMARYLGTENFGILNYSLAYIMIFTAVSKLGIDSIIVNEIINNKEESGKVIGTTIYLRLVSSFISILLIFLLVKLLNPNYAAVQLITLIQSISLVLVIFDTIGFWFQSKLQSKYVVIAKSSAFAIVVLWRLALIYFEKSIYYFAVATVIEGFAISLFMIAYYIKFKGPKIRFSFEKAKHLISGSFYYFIAGLLIVVYTQLDKIMLGKMAGSTTVGIYSAAFAISSLWVFIPTALIDSARPLIMTSKNENEASYIRKYKQLYCSIIWMGLGAALVITLLSKPIILLIYGKQFIESVSVLIILIWSRIFSLMGTIRAIWLTIENFGKYQVFFVGIGAVINIVLNISLIPHYGAIGAAIATLIAEVISAFIAVLFFKQTRPLFKLIIQAFLFKGVKA